MNLLLALERGLDSAARRKIERLIPEMPVTTASDPAAVGALLGQEPYDVVVISVSLARSLPASDLEVARESELILITPHTVGADSLGADDFIVSADEALPLDEIAARVRLARRRLSRMILARQRQEAIARSLQEIVYRLDDQGRFVYINQAVSRLGYDPEDLLGMHFSSILDPSRVRNVSRDHVLSRLKGENTGADAAPKLFDERRRGERRTRDLEVILRGAGQLAASHFVGVVTASGDVMTRVDGIHEVVGTIGVIRDASSDGRSADTLRKLFAMAESAPYGVLVSDGNLRVDYANPGFYRWFSLTPMQVIGRGLADVELEGFDERLAAVLEESISRGVPCQRELVLQRATDDAQRYLLTGRPVYDAEQECTGVVLTLTPAPVADAMTVPEADPSRMVPIATILESVIAAVREELGEEVEIAVTNEVQGDMGEAMGRLAHDVLHDLVEFGLFVTDGGSMELAAYPDQDQLVLHVSALRTRDGRAQNPPDTLRLRALVNRSEELRAAVIRGGGSWNVERGERGVVFRVRVPRTTTAAHRGPASKERSFDLDRFLAAYGDDPDISREILRLYRDEAPARLATIADAITHEELAPVIKAAHSLANTSGTLQSDEAVEAARELEQAARTNDLDRVRATFERLKPIVEAMVREIDLALDDAG